MGKTKIEWATHVWNPVRGCTRVSRGCEHCYAERMAARRLPGLMSPTTGEPYATMTADGPRWTGQVELIERQLEVPMRWKNPRRIFVNSMSDTFHEALPDEAIDRIFAVMAMCPQHTFFVLTKRAERMEQYAQAAARGAFLDTCAGEAYLASYPMHRRRPWPLGNVWLGVSVEARANKYRIDALRKTPAALRFLSLEPLLEDLGELDLRGIRWVIVGGESGPGARPCSISWIRSVVEQCRAAKVSCFVKQLGAHIRGDKAEFRTIDWDVVDGHGFGLCDRKGGDPDEWPEDIRVRQMPEAK